MSEVALAVEGMTRRIGACVANDDVTVRVRKGSVHAIVGENGAGKTTLLRLAYGEIKADAGKIAIDGVEVPIGRHSPAAAIDRGVGMVHQHFMLIPTLSVVENVVLGREPRRGMLLDLAGAAREVREIARRVEREIDPQRLVGTLSVGEQQYVEIVKILWRGAQVLLLDEPTAVLTPGEVAALFRVLEALAAEGRTIVLVTHKLDEVAAIADRVTVLRRGKVVAEMEAPLDRDAIARAMVGGSVDVPVAAPHEPGEVALTVDHLTVGRAVRDVSFAVRRGEIVGLAGVQGNGQSELVLAAAGLIQPAAGSVNIAGARAHVPEDRQRRGLILDFTVAENLILGRQHEFTRGGRLDRARIARYAGERIRALDVRPPDRDAPVRALSGGNQQKVVVARELSRPGLTALICAEPTRGVDIGAAAEIHRQILAVRDAGAAVLLVSSELSELRALASRILVIHRGAIVAELPVADATDETLGAYMTGVRA